MTGNFSRGEVIRICNLEGRDIAHGVSRYNSDALRRIAGHHSQEIDAILGYEYGPVAVHRDDMITVKEQADAGTNGHCREASLV